MVARKKDLIPNTFATPESAGEFWDKHSLADYEDETAPVTAEFLLTKRTRYISIPDGTYRKLASQANRRHQSVRQMVIALVG